MGIIVQKFGGSSVADTKKLFGVCKHITKAYDKGNQVVVVVSAQGKTTDGLLNQIDEITKTPSKRECDLLLATGEQITIAKLSMCLEELGYKAVSYMGWQVPIITDSNYSNARIKYIENKNIEKDLASGKIVIVAGFQGIDSEGNVTTLGRGGSDTTAAALAASLHADKCEIYTDVDGVFSSDPQIIDNVKKIDMMSYDEMLELASLGAKVLHNRCVGIGKSYDTPIQVKSTFQKDSEGTIVKSGEPNFESFIISGITKEDNNARVSIICDHKDFDRIYKAFCLLADHNINVDVIVKSYNDTPKSDISFSIHSSDLEKTLEILNRHLQEINAKEILHSTTNLCKVSIVGTGMINTPGVAATMFETLYESGIRIHMISTSEIKISVLVDQAKGNLAMKALHDKFF